MDASQILQINRENISLAKKGRFVKREALPRALELLKGRHILSIVGVRRCGKSTLMKELVLAALKNVPEQNVFYLNLEHPFFNQYKGDVVNLQEMYDIFRKQAKGRVYVFFDEVQFFSDWQVFVKSLYEKDEAKIVLTGSNSRLLSSELATLLSGRAIPLHLYPFSLSESGVGLKKYLVDGGFPEVVLKIGDKKDLAEIYYKNILYQDVIPRFNVQNTLAMENLSYYLISNIAKPISYNTLKAISHLDDKTAKQYMAYLQDANLLYVVSNYDYSLKKLIGNIKKPYLVDPLFSHLSFRNSPDDGRLFENFVYMALRRSGIEVFFHHNGGECDFLIKEGHRITMALQACTEITKDNHDRENAGLLSAMERFKLKEGYLVTIGQNNAGKIIDAATLLKKLGMDSEK
jgi:hypothetical protein